MTENMQEFTKLLIDSYNKYVGECFQYNFEHGVAQDENSPVKHITSRWGDTECKLLGKTPKDAIGENLPDEIEFDDIVYMFNSFAVEGDFNIPDAVCDLFFSAPAEAEEYILSVIDGMDLTINGDKIISDEQNEMLCIFLQAVENLHRIPKDVAKERLLCIFEKCEKDNYLINETVCDAMLKCGFVADMVELLDSSTKIGEKEHYILQALVTLTGDEDVFRCLKACLKKDCEDISMTVQIVSDCGDGRLIPLMRKIARNQLKALFDAGKSPYDESEESQEFFLICNAITRLGGSIEDLLVME